MAYISFQPIDNFKTHLFTGTGASNAQTFPETTAMQPDIVWVKNRDEADFHVFANSISGATKYIETNDSLFKQQTQNLLKVLIQTDSQLELKMKLIPIQKILYLGIGRWEQLVE